MAKRRSLVSGIKKPDLKKEREFIFGSKKTSKAKSENTKRKIEEEPPELEAKPNELVTIPEIPTKPEPTPIQSPIAPMVRETSSLGRSPLTTRLRTDLFTALKRASLERQLAGVEPNTVQDLLETALEPWLREQGYLK